MTNYLSDTERESLKEYITDKGVHFVYTRDLRDTTIIGYEDALSPEAVALAVFEFAGVWYRDTYPLLNGFPGWDTVKFEVRIVR